MEAHQQRRLAEPDPAAGLITVFASLAYTICASRGEDGAPS